MAKGQPRAWCPQRHAWVRDDDDQGSAQEASSWPQSWIGDHAMKRQPGTPTYAKAQPSPFRLWSAQDRPIYGAYLRDPSLWLHMPEPPPSRLDDADLDALIALSADAPHHHVRAALQEGQPVGQMRLEFIGAHRSKAELSYWLGAPHRGQGIGRALVTRFVQQALAEFPGLDLIVARVHPQNTASARLLQGCGFTATTRQITGLTARGRDEGDWPVFALSRFGALA